MRPIHSLALTLPVVLALAACGSPPPPQTTQVFVQQPQPTVVPMAPMPPPGQSELVPPPPPSNVPTVWQPGHWRYTGVTSNPWTWQNGQYVAVPQGASAWVPGQWQQQGGGFVWREGHWA
jgi:hypothetical protein